MTDPQITDPQQEKKRKNNKTTGIVLIILGIVGLSLRFVFSNNNNNGEWRTVDVLKIGVSIVIIIYGAVTVYKNRK